MYAHGSYIHPANVSFSSHYKNIRHLNSTKSRGELPRYKHTITPLPPKKRLTYLTLYVRPLLDRSLSSYVKLSYCGEGMRCVIVWKGTDRAL